MSNQRILVAEDNPGLARVLEFKLCQEGFDVVVCPDGHIAWEQVQAEQFDAVVTDYEMPRVNGAELCEKIREVERLASLPIMLVTAREPELDVDEVKRQGVTEVYAKPYSPRQLIEAIRKLLDEAAKCVQRAARNAGMNMSTADTRHPDELQQELELLRHENESLAGQLAHAFEELALLQQLGSRLALDETTREAEFSDVLADVLEVVRGESVYFAMECEDAEDTEATVTAIGSSCLSPEDCLAVIREFESHAATRTVVHNATVAPGVEQLMVAELNSSGRRLGWLMVCNRIGAGAEEGFTSIESSFLGNTASMLASHLHNVALLRQKEDLFTDMVHALVSAVDARDPYTCGHSERVALSAKLLAQRAGKSVADCHRLYLTGLLHDVGKIAVPDAILRKDGRLSDEEFGIIALHPENGWKILSAVESLKHVLPGVLHHHESLDGAGYPDRLTDEEIPEDARYVAICDTFDAMTSDRPYRKGMPPEKAASILRQGAGSQWDAELVELFLNSLDDMTSILQQHRRVSQAPDSVDSNSRQQAT